jgi:hypothetical protein
MNFTVHWLDFVRFIQDQDMWSRWAMQYDPSQETYLEANLLLINEKKTGHNFDFAKLHNVQVLSKDNSLLNWEHDGESLWYFFQKWSQGIRI